MFPGSRDHGHPETGERRAREARVTEEPRLARNGVEVVAHGAMICPGCQLPVASNESIPAGASMACGYCGQAGMAREFLVEDVFDTLANEVYMVARLSIRVA